jgi:hypothetical protein
VDASESGDDDVAEDKVEAMAVTSAVTTEVAKTVVWACTVVVEVGWSCVSTCAVFRWMAVPVPGAWDAVFVSCSTEEVSVVKELSAVEVVASCGAAAV